MLFKSGGAYLVARQGLMLSSYGAVDALQAKQRLLAGAGGGSAAAPPPLPVSPAQLEDFEAFEARFWAGFKSRLRTGRSGDVGLDLEELEDGSPLEMCYLLGKLQEPGARWLGWAWCPARDRGLAAHAVGAHMHLCCTSGRVSSRHPRSLLAAAAAAAVAAFLPVQASCSTPPRAAPSPTWTWCAACP